jgi:hypothetical protein
MTAMTQSRRLVLPVLLLALVGAAAPAKEDTLGQKVLAFAQKHKGEQVGNGECAVLASEAYKAAGAARRGPDAPDKGDYTWGKLVFTLDAAPPEKPAAATPPDAANGKPTDIRPGDVIQFRNAKFRTKVKGGTYTNTMPHHTAIVASVEENGATIHILHQNHNGNKTVQDATLHLADLKEGWLRFYHPLPAGK